MVFIGLSAVVFFVKTDKMVIKTSVKTLIFLFLKVKIRKNDGILLIIHNYYSKNHKNFV